jgi:adenylyltransferase/sulfurtransferase
MVIGSQQAAEAIKVLSDQPAAISRDLVVIDVWSNALKRMRLDGLREKGDCPVCRHGRYDWLSGSASGHTMTLCGRNAVQVAPASRQAIDLATLSDRLAGLATVRSNEYLARFAIDGFEFSVFADGRAIIKGTDDVALARSLYARYLGS